MHPKATPPKHLDQNVTAIGKGKPWSFISIWIKSAWKQVRMASSSRSHSFMPNVVEVNIVTKKKKEVYCKDR